MMSNCNNSTLATYSPSAENPWNIKRAKHLYRRLGFGASIDKVKNALSQNPIELIDTLIDEAVNKPIMENPGWGLLNYDEIGDFFGTEGRETLGVTRVTMKHQFYDDMRSSSLRDRLTLFWSGHFVTQDVLLKLPPHLFQQYIMRQEHAIGNFKEFVRAVGTDPYMLYYLNGWENTAQGPNENYARELYELFTLGVDNGYTEQDIVETARALTGYNSREARWGSIVFNEDTFDSGEKTIFGRTGNWGYDDVIDILFEEKGALVAKYICYEFYKYFISLEVNETIVEELAQTFLDNDFEIEPVMRQLFKSEHFFDENCIGTLIKSPIDLIITYQNEIEMHYTNNNPNYDYSLNDTVDTFTSQVGMSVFDPPNVFGWQGGKSWINTDTLPNRWLRMNHVIISQVRDNPNDTYQVFRDFALKLFYITETDPEVIAKGIVNFFLSADLANDSDYDDAINIFKGKVPSNYYEDGTWTLDYPTLGEQVHGLIRYFIIELPEFQLI